MSRFGCSLSFPTKGGGFDPARLNAQWGRSGAVTPCFLGPAALFEKMKPKIIEALQTVLEFVAIFVTLLLISITTYVYSEFRTFRWDWKQVGPRLYVRPSDPLYWAEYEKAVREYKAKFPQGEPIPPQNENSEAVRRAFPRGDEALYRWK